MEIGLGRGVGDGTISISFNIRETAKLKSLLTGIGLSQLRTTQAFGRAESLIFYQDTNGKFATYVAQRIPNFSALYIDNINKPLMVGGKCNIGIFRMTQRIEGRIYAFTTRDPIARLDALPGYIKLLQPAYNAVFDMRSNVNTTFSNGGSR